jgi:hypothetical protein
VQISDSPFGITDWPVKGHIGRTFTLTPGVSDQVADNAEPHRSRSTLGATLFIVD